MRIALVSPQYLGAITGGGGVHVLELSKRLCWMGHDVTVIAVRVSGLRREERVNFYAPDGRRGSVRVIRVEVSDWEQIHHPYQGTKREEIRRLMEFKRGALEVIESEQFDIVHLHGHFVTPSMAKDLKERGKRGVVVTFHAFESLVELEKGAFASPPDVREAMIRMEREGLRYADAVIVASRSLFRRVMQVHGAWIDERKVYIVYSGVSDHILNSPRQALSDSLRRELCGDDYMLFSLGRIDPSKTIEYAIRALSNVARSVKERTGRGVTLVIAGKFEQRNADYLKFLEEEAQRVRSSGARVVFRLDVSEDEKLALLDAADVFVMSAVTEPFGIVILEALARKLPVVVTDAEGPREIFGIEDAIREPFIEVRGGLMVSFSNPATRVSHLARALTHALLNLDRMRELAKEGRELVMTKFTWDAVAKKVNEIYLRVLGG